MAKGGLTKGKSHAKGGIKMTVKDTGQQIEVEGGEGIINKYVMSSDKKISYKGKKATPCEIASDLNQQTGNGVAFDCKETKNTDMTPTDASTGFGKGGTPNGGSVEFEGFTPEYPYAKGGSLTTKGLVLEPIKLTDFISGLPSTTKLALSDTDIFNKQVPISGSKKLSRYPTVNELFKSTNNDNVLAGNTFAQNSRVVDCGIGSGKSFRMYTLIAKVFEKSENKNNFRVIVLVYNKTDLNRFISDKNYLGYEDFPSLKEAKMFASSYLWFIRRTYNNEDNVNELKVWIENNKTEWDNDMEYVDILKSYTYPLKQFNQLGVMPSSFEIAEQEINLVSGNEKNLKAKQKDKTQQINKEKLEGSQVAEQVIKLSMDLFNPLFIKSIRQNDTFPLTEYENYEKVLKEISERGNLDKLEANALKVSEEQFPNSGIKDYIDNFSDLKYNGGSRMSINRIIETQKELTNKLKTVKKDVAVVLAPILKLTKKATDYLQELDEGTPPPFNPKASKIRESIDGIKNLLPYFDDGDYELQKQYFAELQRLTLELNELTKESISLRDKMFKYYRDLTRDVPDYTQEKPSEIIVYDDLGMSTPEKSQLTLTEYIQVRTDKFKNWFGDWQNAIRTNNYSGVSKVINSKTKEPLVVFHGTGGLKVPFTEFTFDKFPVNYFGENYKYADWFKKNRPSVNLIYGVFLSIKNPLDFSEFSYKPLTYEDFILAFKVKYGIDIPYDKNMQRNSELLFSKGDFKPPFWWYIRNGRTWLNALKKTRFDGLCFIENNPSDKTDGVEEITKAWCIFDANQVKLAGGLNKEFSLLKDDIRMNKGGSL
jgi:hypothetical protein